MSEVKLHKVSVGATAGKPDGWFRIIPATTAEIMDAHPKCGECNRREHDADDTLGGWCSWLGTPIYADFYCRHWEEKKDA